VGMTNSLERRFIEHVWKIHKVSFTARYNITDLVYFEEYSSSLDTIKREKQIKGWARKRKMNLIKTINPEMKNLFTVTSS
jgi:putative endonuclease